MKKNKSTEKPVTNEQIRPQLQFAVFCDGVTPPDQRGKVSFIGIFDKFLRPGIIPHFTLCLGWKNGKGHFVQSFRILDPNLKELLKSPDLPVDVKHETDSVRNVINIDGINFPTPGVYWIEILLEGETVTSIPLAVENPVQ